MSDNRPEDSKDQTPSSTEQTESTNGPIGRRAEELRARDQSSKEAKQNAAREDPLAASKGKAERIGDFGSSKIVDGTKSAIGKGANKLNAGISKVAEGDGAAGKVARGVQAAQQAAKIARSVGETAKNIAVSAKGLVVALGNPIAWIVIAVVLVLTFITLSAVTGVQVYGKNDSVDNCSANGSVSGGIDIPVNATTEQNRDAMMGWLMRNNFRSNGNKPLTKEQAAAVAGNFAAESNFGFDVTEGHVMDGASNDEVDSWTRGGPRGLGMAQWTWNPGRAGTLIQLAKSMSKNWYDPEIQFQMILNEMDGAYGPMLASAGFFAAGGEPGPLAIIFHDVYEGSADDAAKKARRSAMAEDAYANGNAGGYSSAGGDNCQQAGPTGDWVYPVEMRNGEPLNWTTYFGSVAHEAGALDINGNGNGGAPTDWPVYAASDGVVLTIGDGNCIPLTVWHERDGVASAYHHMNSKVVRTGDTVRAGQHLGGIGTRGCGSTGNHLHFEIQPDARFGAPMPAWKFMKEHGVDMGRCMSSSSECALAGAPAGG